jgi:integrase
VSLTDARTALLRVKEILRQGHDPVQQRQITVASNQAAAADTFSSISGMWFEKMRKDWSAAHYTRAKRAIERELFPPLGALPINQIDSFILAQAMQPAVDRGVIETADRIFQHCTGIFNFAKGLKVYTGDNPVPGAREVVMRKRPTPKRMPAILEWKGLGEILRKAKAARISPAIYMLHRLIAFSSVRIGTAVLAEWKEFDLNSTPAIWTIPRAKMKMKSRHNDHRIPLHPVIAQELKEWKALGLSKRLVFPSPQASNAGKPISSEGLEKAYRVTMGLEGKHTPHGWRAAFSTLARDNNFNREVIEMALDHCHDDDVAMAYDRGERWEDRIALFRWWGDQLTATETKG